MDAYHPLIQKYFAHFLKNRVHVGFLIDRDVVHGPRIVRAFRTDRVILIVAPAHGLYRQTGAETADICPISRATSVYKHMIGYSRIYFEMAC